MDASQLKPNDLKITQNDGKVRKLFIRPHTKEFLLRMSRHYEIIIFTAATKCYADQIRKILDPTDSIISHLLDRQVCFNPNKGTVTENKLPFIKDLRKLNRDLSQTILLDNSIYCFWYQINNGIPIVSYNKERKDDTELLKVSSYLMRLVGETDVRKKNQEYFKLEKYEEHVDARTLVEELYMNEDDDE
jgi:CTD small phosphatase-like protein 2